MNTGNKFLRGTMGRRNNTPLALSEQYVELLDIIAEIIAGDLIKKMENDSEEEKNG